MGLPLLSTLPTNSTCLSQSDPCIGAVGIQGGCGEGAWLVTCSHIVRGSYLSQTLGRATATAGWTLPLSLKAKRARLGPSLCPAGAAERDKQQKRPCVPPPWDLHRKLLQAKSQLRTEGLSTAFPTWLKSSADPGHLRQKSGLGGWIQKLPLSLTCVSLPPWAVYCTDQHLEAIRLQSLWNTEKP